MKMNKGNVLKLIAQSFVSLALFSNVALAAAKTLISMEGGRPKAELAKSWKKVKDDEFEFVIDTTAELKSGVKLTAKMVKDSLESKLGSSLGVKVTATGVDRVKVKYQGAESDFLEQVSKTKIRGGQDVELALESTVSEGSIRAKQADRPPTQGEVKALVARIDGNTITAVVNASHDPKIQSGKKIKVKGEIKGLKKNDTIFFKPSSQEGDLWVPTPNSLK